MLALTRPSQGRGGGGTGKLDGRITWPGYPPLPCPLPSPIPGPDLVGGGGLERTGTGQTSSYHGSWSVVPHNGKLSCSLKSLELIIEDIEFCKESLVPVSLRVTRFKPDP